MEGPQTAQDFIRALKAPSDPPHAGGPSKIEIATRTWRNTSLYVPNKAEAIVDWLLTRLLKDKSKDAATNPIRDARHWDLLNSILISLTASKADSNVQAVRAWLVPLLNRTPIAPVFLAYVSLSLSAAHAPPADLHPPVARCISILWPLAASKFSPETLLECFSAVTTFSLARDAASHARAEVRDESHALALLVASYRSALGNSASKRKQLCALFLKNHLAHWLRFTHRYHTAQPLAAGAPTPPLVADVYAAGIETMYGIETLRASVEQGGENQLADALASVAQNEPEVTLNSLPRLFASYVQHLKKHKGALFSQGSNQAAGHMAEQVQSAGMAFYAHCDTLLEGVDGDLSWRVRVALLNVVEQEGLFAPKDDTATRLLRHDGDLALDVLASAARDAESARTDYALQTLSALAKIDHDLMASALPRVFARLITVPGSNVSAMEYLRLLLEYDSKTRTLPAAVLILMEAFSPHHLEKLPEGPRPAYDATCSSASATLWYHEQLSRAVSVFLTPGQVSDVVNGLLQKLRDGYARFVEQDSVASSNGGEGSRKKRKKDGAAATVDRTDPEYAAISFALQAKIAGTVLASLPLHSVLDDVRRQILTAITEAHATVVVGALRDALAVSDSRRGAWHWQVIATAVLRLHYGLARSPTLGLASELHLDASLPSALLASARSEETVPELAVEIYRTLLDQCDLGRLEPQSVIENVLAYLEVSVGGARSEWSGRSHHLTKERGNEVGALAVLYLLTDRWLFALDTWYSSQQRKRFAQLLASVRWDDVIAGNAAGLTTRTIFTRMLHNAEFWELSSFRDVFLAQLYEQTAPLDNMHLEEILSQLKTTTVRPPIKDTTHIISVYRVLLLAAPEYLPRSMHVDFLRRALSADVAVLLAGRSKKAAGKNYDQHLLVVREFIRRTLAHLGANENLVSQDFVDYLLEQEVPNGSEAAVSRGLLQVTVDVVDLYQSTLLKSAKKAQVDHLDHLLQVYEEAFEDDMDADVQLESFSRSARRRGCVRHIDSVVGNSSKSDFPAESLKPLQGLYTTVLGYTLPRLRAGASMDASLLQLWSHVLSLGHWLEAPGEGLPQVGQQLVQTLLQKPDGPVGDGVHASILAILCEELRASPPESREQHLNCLILGYLTISRACDSSALTEIETKLASACRTFPVADYSLILELIYEALPVGGRFGADDIARLIRLSTVLIHDAPEGTSKVTQAHTTRCLALFADNRLYTTSPCLRREVLNSLVRQCTDRPASLRPADLSPLWSILRALLEGSPTHDPTGDPTIFHGLLALLSALIRLRRDLALHTLPHLAHALARLAACLRTPRAHLGASQTRLVAATLPAWHAALGADDARALARLLTALSAKTSNVRGMGGGNAESLARPFARHAAGVLGAYVAAAGDPLCVVPGAVRRELLPGLFALCEMLGERGRDAMMAAALDAGGKAAMKMLWREYEKQRYVGKG